MDHHSRLRAFLGDKPFKANQARDLPQGLTDVLLVPDKGMFVSPDTMKHRCGGCYGDGIEPVCQALGGCYDAALALPGIYILDTPEAVDEYIANTATLLLGG